MKEPNGRMLNKCVNEFGIEWWRDDGGDGGSGSVSGGWLGLCSMLYFCFVKALKKECGVNFFFPTLLESRTWVKSFNNVCVCEFAHRTWMFEIAAKRNEQQSNWLIGYLWLHFILHWMANTFRTASNAKLWSWLSIFWNSICKPQWLPYSNEESPSSHL